VDRIAFSIGSFSIHWYGILVATGFLFGLWTAGRRGLREGLSPDQIADLGVWLIVGSVVGARALFVASYWREQFADKPWTEVFMIRHGGLVFYGGLVGASAATILCVWRKKLPLWKTADALAPSIALGYVPGRIGCLMNGCCYGRPTDLPWAIHFPPEHETGGVGVHPTEIYDSLLNLALYLALAWLYRRKRFDGQVFATYLIAYAVTRSTVEMFRGDYGVRYLGGWATPAHLISLGVLAAGLVLFWKLSRPGPKKA
jgi:phosphatidylglycerol---prolipoprotein diacylglyceryl transferase